jgi:hypothetical protein
VHVLSVGPLTGGAESRLTYQPLVWGKCMKSLAADACEVCPSVVKCFYRNGFL